MPDVSTLDLAPRRSVSSVSIIGSVLVGTTRSQGVTSASSDNSSISFIYITDKQYLMTENYLGKNFEENEEEYDYEEENEDE